MPPLRRLIHEIHRRSLWQVIGIYLAGAWVALQVVEQLAEAAGLPEWVRPLMLAFLVVGFPLVVATAFVQEGLGLRDLGSRRESGADDGAVTPPAAVAPSGAQNVFTWRNVIGGGVVALAIWGLVALGWVFLGGEGPEGIAPRTAVADPSEALLPKGEERRRSVAVLPFDNLSPDAENAFFADGVHESILMQVSKIGDLRVLSRASMLRYRDTDLTLSQIAAEVGAGVILQASVQRAADQLRVIVQLIDPNTEETIWADTYDGSVSGIFDFQSEVALAVAGKLQATLSPREQRAVTRHATESMTAFDFYLRGRSEYAGSTREGNEEAIRLFNEAIAEDSSFALAWAGLADGYAQRVQLFGYPARWADSVRVAAERALEIDPELPEGYKSLGLALSLKGRATEARDMWLQAFELNPNLSAAVNNIGYGHSVVGEQHDGLRWFKRAFILSPNLVLYRSNIAYEYLWLGEYDIARAWLDRARARWPRNRNVEMAQWHLDVDESGPVEANRRLAVTYGDDPDAPGILAALAAGAMLSGDAETALAYAVAASAAVPDGGAPVAFYDSRIVRAWALSRDGLTSEALEILNAIGAETDRLVEQGAETARLYYLAGQVHALRGSNEEAVRSLVNAFEAGYTYYNWFDLDPTISAVRDDPRLVDLRHAAEIEITRQRAEIEAEERAAGERD